MAEDIQILEHYLTSTGAVGATTGKPYSVIPSAPGKPIVYLRVPRRREGLGSEMRPGSKQREIMEQVLGTFKEDVVKLYFDKLHPCFPIIDEKTFHELWQRDPDRISSTIVCDMYAVALKFWNTSGQLKSHQRPDLAFMWNQAVAGLQEDFLGSTISTVHAALLDLIGRPVLSITGNIVTLGRTITLAHSLGLHRDPSSWHATEHEKNVRIRLWWGVLIHDHWSSLAHGTPPLVQRQNYDVPLPDALNGTTASSFPQLCALSQILGTLLPLVYSLHGGHEETMRQVRKSECDLDDWQRRLPTSLHYKRDASTGTPNGVSNLQFCYLSVKLLLCRIAFKAAISESAIAEARSYRLAMLREAAIALTDFVTALDSTQLAEFWLPYTAHLLVTATTILLRCLLESTDVTTKHTCAEKLVRLVSTLKVSKEEHDWDLADFCLERCSEPISKISSALGIVDEATGSSAGAVAQAPVADESIAAGLPGPVEDWPLDVLFPVDSLDYPFDAMWDMPL
ncbi:uncharacterized protein MYCGRDRAFT_61319 [Zymoseptoria tritici IPO323]|uniref:Xylanolytic transcriptional activator regulatory domain-containing protein n=2 Tax=Zymoseptoria tritici TaxID=1047171 RepID=F9XIF2_ZYMTI|nr:uncharacterized protein MYCGRDRAFT_61319 [Zymoseptoria tritici IPO323]EGP85465.1 hypothetical protein MYCGRDRAFT_61319 [Zymoseptoria tritici IPO323]